MTTRVTIHAGHGWPVDVKAFTPRGDSIPTYGGRVPAGETRDFIVHSEMDLHIHEVQPAEIQEEIEAEASADPAPAEQSDA